MGASSFIKDSAYLVIDLAFFASLIIQLNFAQFRMYLSRILTLAIFTTLFHFSVPGRVSGQENGAADKSGGKEVSAKAVAVSEVPMGWTTQAILSSYVNDSRAEGYMDLLIPLLQNDDGMLFLYPRFGLSSDVDPGYSLGVGARHYIASIDAIIGGNAFFDRYDSPGGNYYNQLGLGVEVLTRWVDARFNYYIPDSSPNVIDTQNVRSRSVSTSSAWGQPYATGYTIRQPLTTTTRTTTVNQLFERFEDSMEGLDAEVGVLTPWLEQYVALRWFAGCYHFNNSYGSDISGVKGRAELRFSEKLAVDATYYQDEEVAGSNWLFGVRMTIPVYMENLADGRSPFEGSFSGMFDGVNLGGRGQGSSGIRRGGSASANPGGYTAMSPFAAMAPAPTFAAAGTRGSTVRDRMVEEVMRLSDGARTSESDFIENVAKRDVDVDVERKTRIVVVEDSIVFVSNGRGVAGNPGTFENPLNTIQGGVNRASTLFGNRGDVFVSGTGTNYTEDVVDAGSSVKIWGGGRGFPVNGGRRFTHGSQPMLDGGFQIDDVPLFSLSGFSIINGFSGGHGVQVVDVNDVTIVDNTITGTGAHGIRLRFNDINANFNVSNNQVNNNVDNGLRVRILANPGMVNGTISGNTFMGNNRGFGIRVDSTDTSANKGSVVNLGISNNVVSGNATTGGRLNLVMGGDAGDPNNPVVNTTLTGNQFTGNNNGFSLFVDSDNNAVQNFVARGNSFSGNTANGFRLIADTDDAMLSATFVSNAFLNNGNRGLDIDIDADGEDTAVFDIKLIQNRFQSNQNDGLRFDLTVDDGDEVTANLIITGNTFITNGLGGAGNGARVNINIDGIDDEATVTTVFSNNVVTGNNNDGLRFEFDADDNDSGSASINLSGNQFLNNGDDSLDLLVSDNDLTPVFMSTLDNTSAGAGGFSLRDRGTGDSTGSILLNGATINFPNPGNVP